MVPAIPLAIVLALVSAGFNASWNVLMKRSEDPLRLAARAMSAAVLVITPVVGIAWVLSGRPGIPLDVWPIAVLSAVIELIYFSFLSSAYARGELSAVYPLARGTAPLLSVLAGLLILHERLQPIEVAGIVLLLAGIWAVRRPQPAGAATVPALLTGVAIAAYSAVDARGVHLLQPWLYGWLIWVLTALLLEARVAAERLLVRRTSGGPPAAPGPVDSGWPVAVAVGVLMTASYFMTLVAFRIAPLAVVAPLRESAIVLVTAWGVWRLGERRGMWLRLTGAAGILLGVGLLALA